jgi:TonB-dependent SusC/RagA subfamily outer membrane receptor
MKRIFIFLLLFGLLQGQVFAQVVPFQVELPVMQEHHFQGVSVVATPSGIGSTTDATGTYAVTLPENARSLTFSYVNYASQTVTIGTRTTVDVVMQADDRSLAEVVVVGYGTQRRRDVTGSVATVAGAKIKDAPVQSFDQALSGRMAGVNVTMPNGVLNNPPVIRIRGVNSISLSSFPLVVVDGIPAYSGNVGAAVAGTVANNPLGDINPSDIESIDVLKDAAASAIYGSRASAGVLLITTKRGRAGRTRVSYDGWVGSTRAFRLIPMLNGQEYTEIKNEGLANLGTPANGIVDPVTGNVTAPTGVTGRGFYMQRDAAGNPINTNWYDEVYRTGVSSNHAISIAGANEKNELLFFCSLHKTGRHVKRQYF